MAHDYLKYSRVVCSFFHLITVCRGVLCRLYCPYGFVRVNGCPICNVKESLHEKLENCVVEFMDNVRED